MITTRFEDIELDRLREFRSHGWGMIKQRIEDMISGEHRTLETCAAAELQQHQGIIQGLRSVLRVPEIIEQEIAASIDREKKQR